MTSVALYNMLLSAIVLSGVYALVTLGFVIVFRATRVFNFLHPNLMLAGALLFTTLNGPGLGGFVTATILSTIAITVLGFVIYYVVMARCAGIPHWVQMILTMGLSLMAINIEQLIWGYNERRIRLPIDQALSWTLPGGAVLSGNDLVLFVTSVLLSVGFYWLLVRSPIAARLTAAAEQPRLAAYSGIQITFWYALSWGLAGFCAAVSGILYASRSVLNISMVEVGLAAFPAAMIGGMTSIEGVFLGAVILALIQQFATFFWGSQVGLPVAFALVFVILMFRPQGLLGGHLVARV